MGPGFKNMRKSKPTTGWKSEADMSRWVERKQQQHFFNFFILFIWAIATVKTDYSTFTFDVNEFSVTVSSI